MILYIFLLLELITDDNIIVMHEPPSTIGRKAILDNFLQTLYAFIDKISIERNCCYVLLHDEATQNDPEYFEIKELAEFLLDMIQELAIWWNRLANRAVAYSEYLLVEGST